MAANPSQPGSDYRFEGHTFAWEPFLGEQGVLVAIVDVDAEHDSVDLVVKFAPGKKAPMHRHLAAYTSLVLEGEHRIYERDENGNETVKIRPAGTFTRADSGGVHDEGGGAEGGTVWFNLRPHDGGLYEILGDDGKPVDRIALKDLLEEG